MNELAALSGVSVRYASGGRVHVGLDRVDYAVAAHETAAVIGESGCGKTTLGRTLLLLQTPSEGRVHFAGEDLTALSGAALRRRRRLMQMMFQDPYASLNPRMTIGETLAEPLVVHGMETWRSAQARVAEALAMVGLAAAMQARLPHEFSGGQRQRIAIARAVIGRPRLVVADEPLSALDITLQGQILGLFRRLQESLGLTYVFISHDLPVVGRIASRVAVMLGGCIVEEGPTQEVFSRPAHPYTQALLDAVPIADPAAERLRQAREPSSPAGRPAREARAQGCPFVQRCPHAMAMCADIRPERAEVAPGRTAACWLHRADA